MRIRFSVREICEKCCVFLKNNVLYSENRQGIVTELHLPEADINVLI